MNSRYYVATSDIRVCVLDDEAIVFNPFSWETHLLNPAAALVLEVATSAPCTEAVIRNVLEEVLDEEERPRAAEHAQRLLGELVGLRLLIERPAETDAGC